MTTLTAEEKTAILGHVQGFGKALDGKTINTVGAQFHEDAVFVGGAGITVGKAAIQKRFQHMYSGRFKDASNSFSLMNVQKPTPELAIVTASCIARNLKTLKGAAVAELKSNVVTMLVKNGNEWQIVAQAVVNETQSPAVAEVAALK